MRNERFASNEQLIPRIVRDASEEKGSPLLIATIFLCAGLAALIAFCKMLFGRRRWRDG